MKLKNILATLLCCIVFVANAQDKSAVVTVTKGNLLYVGVQNDIEVCLTGYTWDDGIEVSASNGEITEGESNGHFKLSVKSAGSVKVNVIRNGKSVASQVFRVKKLPVPVVKVNGKSGGNISRATLSSQKGINVVLEDFDYDVKFHVTQFTVAAYIKDTVTEAVSTSDQFTAEQKDIIKKANKFVIIKDIKAQSPDGTEFDLQSTAFIVK